MQCIAKVDKTLPWIKLKMTYKTEGAINGASKSKSKKLHRQHKSSTQFKI